KKSDGRKGKETADKKNEEPQIISPQVVEEKKELTPEEIRAKGIKEGWIVIKDGKDYFHCLKKKCGGYVWRPRGNGEINYKELPRQCPKCHNAGWNQL
ncbi:MAG: hypothetical protein ACTSUT_04020, partial [Promethearchaeota archaeon]